jgi:hypothetical protein
MNVGELKKLLKSVDDDRLVVMSSDSEGNNYSPLMEVDATSTYCADSTWSGEVSPEKLTPELIKQGWTVSDICGGVPALVLWPTN